MEKKLTGQGMPELRHHNCGDMIIHFTVQFPKKFWMQDPASFEALRQILPAPALENVPPPDAVTEMAVLEDYEAGEKRSRGVDSQGEPMDEDDEDGHAHADRVQCASQ